MRVFLGIVCFIAAIGFEVGLLYSNAGFSWYGREGHAWAGFLGFGIPMVLLGGGAYALLNKEWHDIFAWACTLSGIVWAAALFVTVGRWTGLISIGTQSGTTFWVGLGSFFAFTLPMLLIGWIGIAYLLEHDHQ